MVRALATIVQVRAEKTVYSALLLEKEPTNMQSQSLAQLIDKGAARGTRPFSSE